MECLSLLLLEGGIHASPQPLHHRTRAERPPTHFFDVTSESHNTAAGPMPCAAPGMATRHGDVVSRIELSRGRAFFAGVGAAKGAEHAVQRGVADAEPVLLADEMMAQMILLDEAAQPGSRHIGNMRDVMHPFIMQDRQHHPEQRGWRGGASESKRE